MNFIFISPNFPHTYWQFCNRLKNNGVNVLGIGNASYEELEESLQSSLTEYYRVNSLENYNEVFRAVAFFSFKYGKIDWLESNNEYWLEQDSRLRTDFHIVTGVQESEIALWKHKSAMKDVYKSAGIPSARCHKITNPDDAREFLSEIGGYPVIAKPDVGVGAANTYKIENDDNFKDFFAQKPEIPYVMEEFIEGDICSYDAITNSECKPLFESMTVWPPSFADIVNRDLDLSYYTCADMPEKLQELGRKALKAFNARRRFVHLEFFRMTKARPNIGGIGDFAALEVNMRPAGGYTPDMMNFAHSTDVYQIWADMVTDDRLKLPESNDHHWCVYASRKDWHKYLYSHEEILNRYGKQIVMCERMPELMWATMGCQMYTAHIRSKNEIFDFISFIHERS